ncbi:MAG: glycerophosphoryl diester phosphodiesterase membrane domain-containing protein [Sporichthyaceae bacterium]
MSDQPGQPGQPGQPPPGPPVPPGWAPVQPPAYGAAPGPTAPPAAGGWTQAPGWGQTPGWGVAPTGNAPPAKPGVIPLRPLGVGEILDGAISSIRRDPRLMLGVSAIVVIASTLLQSAITWLLLKDSGAVLTQPTGTVTNDQLYELLGGGVVTFLVSTTISVLAQVLLTGILTFSVSKAVLGEHPRAAEAWQATRRRLPALLGLTVLVLVIVGAAVIVPVLPGIIALVAGSTVAGSILLVVGVPVALVLALAGAVLTWFAAPVVMLERQPVVAALRRSARLVRANFWRVVGLWLLLQLLVGVLGGILGGPLVLVASSVFDNPFGWQSLSLQAVGTILASTVTLPFAAAVAVLVYVDQRMRREALDLELARAAGLVPSGQSATPGT